MNDVENPERAGLFEINGKIARKYALLIAATALIARLAYLWGYRSHPFFEFTFLDPRWHHDWANAVASGKLIGKEAFFRAPLYPYFLGLIYTLTGSSMLAARLAQFALGIASAVMVYLLGLKLLGKNIPAFVAGMFFALYGPMIYFEGELLIPSLIVFLDMAGLILFYAASRKRSAKYYIAGGLVFGLSAIARPNVLVPAAMLAVWAAFEGGKIRSNIVRKAAPFFAALLIFPMLVTAYNFAVSGDFVFIASQGGVNFYIGNNRRADGKSIKGLERAFSAPGDEYRDNVMH